MIHRVTVTPYTVTPYTVTPYTVTPHAAALLIVTAKGFHEGRGGWRWLPMLPVRRLTHQVTPTGCAVRCGDAAGLAVRKECKQRRHHQGQNSKLTHTRVFFQSYGLSGLQSSWKLWSIQEDFLQKSFTQQSAASR
jgi:hypothetical protein